MRGMKTRFHLQTRILICQDKRLVAQDKIVAAQGKIFVTQEKIFVAQETILGSTRHDFLGMKTKTWCSARSCLLKVFIFLSQVVRSSCHNICLFVTSRFPCWPVTILSDRNFVAQNKIFIGQGKIFAAKDQIFLAK